MSYDQQQHTRAMMRVPDIVNPAAGWVAAGDMRPGAMARPSANRRVPKTRRCRRYRCRRRRCRVFDAGCRRVAAATAAATAAAAAAASAAAAGEMNEMSVLLATNKNTIRSHKHY